MSDKTPEERRDEAQAREAEAAAKKAEQVQAEWESELARQARDAAQRQLIAEADEKARKASQTLDEELTLETEGKPWPLGSATSSVGDSARNELSQSL